MPRCYICGPSDQGMTHWVSDDGDTGGDDLHLVIELSAGHFLLLMERDRMFFNEDNDLVIERLMDDEPTLLSQAMKLASSLTSEQRAELVESLRKDL